MALRTRFHDVIDSIDITDAGAGVFSGTGLATLLGSIFGMCPFCVVGLPCPVCALGTVPVVGTLFSGAGLLGFHEESDDAESEACCGADAESGGCSCCQE